MARYRKALGQTAALAPRANQALAEVERVKASVEHERQRMEQESARLQVVTREGAPISSVGTYGHGEGQ